MNNLTSMNKAVFKNMKEFFPCAFKDLNFIDNVLIYKGNENVLLREYDLNVFLNYNSALIEKMSSRDVFEVIKTSVTLVLDVTAPTKAIHETTLLRPIDLETNMQNNDKETRTLSMDEFILLVNKSEEFNSDEKSEIEFFMELFEPAIYYEDYLTPDVKDILFELKQQIWQVRNKDNKVFIQRLYQSLEEKVYKTKSKKEKQLEQMRLLLQKDDTLSNSGYAGAAIIITVIVNIGILIALVLITR